MDILVLAFLYFVGIKYIQLCNRPIVTIHL
jgi:hypothetical protein